jgi:two-component system KDP operon response regulator KdpE
MADNSRTVNEVILIVDDDASLLKLIRDTLDARGYTVRAVPNGAEAIQSLGGPLPDLMLLDLILPDMDGLEVCRHARQFTTLPIVVLSAVGDEKRKVEALDLGADDYLTKPFGMNELLARIRAALRRSRPPKGAERDGPIVVGDLVIDAGKRLVSMAGQEVGLTPTEFNLLCQLATKPGQAFTHQTLLQQVWGREYFDESEYLHVYVGRLRRKIEPDPGRPMYIITIPGVGYKLREP